MVQTLFYSPGQSVTIFLETLSSTGARADGYADASFDGYDYPIVKRMFLPTLSGATGFPAYMSRLDTGLYYYKFTLPTGSAAVGSYLLDVEYTNPTSKITNYALYQIIVTSPYGNFGISVA